MVKAATMSTQPKTFLTPEQYLEIERQAEYKNEYLNGEMFAMESGNATRNVICVNIGSELVRQTRQGPCLVYSSDMRLHVSATGLYTYSDLVAVRDEPKYLNKERDVLLNPSLIVEVVWPKTEAYDRGRKFAHYRKPESLMEYLVVASEEMHADLFRRRPDGSWMLLSAEKPEDGLELVSIDGRLVLADIYERVEF
jgi:Uma2 family endonuclease